MQHGIAIQRCGKPAMEKCENPQQTSIFGVSSTKDQYQRFYLYPIINLFAIGYQRHDSIPSNLRQYITLNLHRDAN